MKIEKEEREREKRLNGKYVGFHVFFLSSN